MVWFNVAVSLRNFRKFEVPTSAVHFEVLLLPSWTFKCLEQSLEVTYRNRTACSCRCLGLLVRVTSEIPILKHVQAISGLLSLKARSACKRFALATSMLLRFDPCGP